MYISFKKETGNPGQNRNEIYDGNIKHSQKISLNKHSLNDLLGGVNS